MEDQFLLNIEDDIHLFSLHYIFLGRINHALGQFLEAWNNHPLSSCHNHSPIQLWIYGLCEQAMDDIDQVYASYVIVNSNYNFYRILYHSLESIGMVH